MLSSAGSPGFTQRYRRTARPPLRHAVARSRFTTFQFYHEFARLSTMGFWFCENPISPLSNDCRILTTFASINIRMSRPAPCRLQHLCASWYVSWRIPHPPVSSIHEYRITISSPPLFATIDNSIIYDIRISVNGDSGKITNEFFDRQMRSSML